MPQINLNPQAVYSLIPPPGHPDRFTHMLALAHNTNRGPLVQEPGPLAVQADNIYAAYNMPNPWDSNSGVTAYVLGDADLAVGGEVRYGHGMLFFEEVPHPPEQAPPPAATPPMLPVPVTTPESVGIAQGAPSVHIPPPPTLPPFVAAMMEQYNTGEDQAIAGPAREDPGEPLELARMLVIALTEALVHVLANSVNNTPPPYGRASPGITYKIPASEYEKYAAAFEPSPTPAPEDAPALVGNLMGMDYDGDQSSVEEDPEVEVIDVDAIPDEAEEEQDELTEEPCPRYNLRPRAAPVEENAIFEAFPSRPNLALQGEEATILTLMLTRAPSTWSDRDIQAVRAIIRSLMRACKNHCGYGEVVHPDSRHRK